MLPKVATHFLHTTSRAAAQVVQTPLRNVLQTGSSSGSNISNRNGPTGSNWGGHGTGAGSTKQNTGSRYYSSFNAAGRAVSQANAVSANDGSFVNSDENDELIPRRVVVIQSQSGNPTKRPRIRSSSVSLTKAESLGVLKTLQLQGRSRFIHTAIEAAPQVSSQSPLPPPRPRRNSTSSSDGLDRPSSPVQNFSVATAESGSHPLPEAPTRPRRNSTSSTHSLDKADLEALDSAVEQVIRSRRGSTSSIDQSLQSDVSSADTRPTTPPRSPQVSKTSTRSRSPLPSISFDLTEAIQCRDRHLVDEAVARLRAVAQDASTKHFNQGLEALYVTRNFESAMPMLELYNDMIKYSKIPDAETYRLLLGSLAQRDVEVASAIEWVAQRKQREESHDNSDRAKRLQDQIDILTLENQSNHTTILSLYSVAKAAGLLPVEGCIDVMRVCIRHSNFQAALDVFRHLEKTLKQIPPGAYQCMIQGYGASNDIHSAEKLFQRYTVDATKFEETSDLQKKKEHIFVWNAMIEAYIGCGRSDKAVDLLGQMVSSPAGVQFTWSDTPVPNALTYHGILKGFIETGDIKSALTWYDRLMEQGVQVTSLDQPSLEPIKPDASIQALMVEALAVNDMVPDLNRVFEAIDIPNSDNDVDVGRLVTLVLGANLRVMSNVTDIQQFHTSLDFLSAKIFPRLSPKHLLSAHSATIRACVRSGLPFDEVLRCMQNFAPSWPQENVPLGTPDLDAFIFRCMGTYIESALKKNTFDFEATLGLMKFCRVHGSPIRNHHFRAFLYTYSVARLNGPLPVDRMEPEDWANLLVMTRYVETSRTPTPESQHDNVPDFVNPGTFAIFEDLAKYEVDLSQISRTELYKSTSGLVNTYGPQTVAGVFHNLGPGFVDILERLALPRLVIENHRPPSATGSSSPANKHALRREGNLVLHTPTEDSIVAALRGTNGASTDIEKAYNLLKNGLNKRRIPRLTTMGRLIQSLGRQGDMEKVHELYAVAQEAYKGLQMQPDLLREAWIAIEDSMIIALAHAGDIDNAHVHRMRLIEQGAAPSADAYGALILYVKDTTDDASNGMALFREAIQSGVEANIYLYNNIISKLAKARKADHALELFQTMKAQGVKPSSITYGALIGACARVGDVQSSEALFKEMVEQKNFKPRVPPYNTMMQLYTMTKPNRERALWFYDQMTAAGVKPTAHTYKLLLDTYGSIEPVDITSMEGVFNDLQKNTSVKVQGTHYASLTNAYGCVQRDLDKSISTFNSVPSHILDAVVFESVINVFVSHRRTDLIPEYLEKMNAAGIHMTAYIANFLIKGYAIVGELEKSREVFEGLLDPPTGVAAPNNHAPHDPSVNTSVGAMEPVYREPSTWEAMVRAELGAGYRDRALDLLHRLRARQYPEAVYNRISGIMVDYSSVLPQTPTV